MSIQEYGEIDETKPAYVLDSRQSQLHKANDAVFTNYPQTESTSIESLFGVLVDEWSRETAHQSIISQRLQHPAYKKILGLGASVVPLILEEMENRPDHWFHALTFLTGENPIPSDFTGTVSDAINLWVQWGYSRHVDDLDNLVGQTRYAA